MFVRFAILGSEPDSSSSTGVLVAAHTLRDEGDLTVEEHRQIRLALAWFNMHLKVPPPLKDGKNKRALSWFKTAAQGPMQRMWELKTILDAHGFHVQVLKTQSPGAVIYEDGWQIVAIPAKGVKFT